jgi:hypothetical protein
MSAWDRNTECRHPPAPSVCRGKSWPHGLCIGRFDFRHQSVKSSFLSGGIPAFARKFDAVLALLAHLFFLHHWKLSSAHSELWGGANL